MPAEAVVDAPAPRVDDVLDRLAEREAGALAVVGDRSDPNVRYLAGGEPTRPASEATGDRSPVRAIALVRAAASDRSEDGFVSVVAPDPHAGAIPTTETVLRVGSNEHPAHRLAAELEAASVRGPVLAPPELPHDAALYLEAFDLESTDVVERARRTKTPTERDRIGWAQAAAADGMDRAREVLRAATTVDRADGDQGGDEGAGGDHGGSDSDADGVLYWNDAVLTVERLRRAVNAAIARGGADPAGRTRIALGRASDRQSPADGPLRAGIPIVVDLAPREPAGYHGALARTYVVAGDGGWERRAHVAVERARQAALAVLESGAGGHAGAVHREGAAELAAYGFQPDGEPGLTHRIGSGVGLERRERPVLDGADGLRAGDVIALEPGIADGDREIRLGDLAVVREDDARWLVEYPTSITP